MPLCLISGSGLLKLLPPCLVEAIFKCARFVSEPVSIGYYRSP